MVQLQSTSLLADLLHESFFCRKVIRAEPCRPIIKGNVMRQHKSMQYGVTLRSTRYVAWRWWPRVVVDFDSYGIPNHIPQCGPNRIISSVFR